MLKGVRREDAAVYRLPGRDWLLCVGPDEPGKLDGEYLVADRHVTTCDLPSGVREGQLAAEGVWRAARLVPPADGIGTRWPLAGDQPLEGTTHG